MELKAAAPLASSSPVAIIIVPKGLTPAGRRRRRWPNASKDDRALHYRQPAVNHAPPPHSLARTVCINHIWLVNNSNQLS